MAKLLPTLEAFRARLRAKYPNRTDLLQINSADQLVYAKRFELQDPGPAHEVLAALRADVASGKLRLRGVLESAMPDDIDLDHRARGELDVLGGTLTVDDKDRFGFTHRKTYTHVYFSAEDLALLDNNEPVTDRPQASSVMQTASILRSPHAKPRRHTRPEQLRTAAKLKALFGDNIPPREQMADGDLLKKVNANLGNGERPISRDTLLRTSGRRPSK
jgi:hypothetical protein